MQLGARKSAARPNQRSDNYSINGCHSIMLKDHKKRIFSSPYRAQIFNHVELLRQLKGPAAVGKQAMLFNKFVIGVDGLLILFVPLARGLLAIGGV